MADITNLERQHKEHGELISKIRMHKSEQQVKENAGNIALLLSQLAGKLKVHAITEDQFLYPSLMNHTNPQIKAKAQEFNTEMGGLAKTFEDFKKRFMTSKKIADNPQDFLVESQKVLTILTKRISKEDIELYPLLTL